MVINICCMRDATAEDFDLVYDIYMDEKVNPFLYRLTIIEELAFMKILGFVKKGV